MAENVKVQDLKPGDVFRIPNRHGSAAFELREVTSIRTQHTGTAYSVLCYRRLVGRANGKIDMKFDLLVERMTPVAYDEAILALSNVLEGQCITLWRRAGGGFYG